MENQKDVLAEDWDWIILCDAGRADAFEQIYPMFFEGEYKRVFNGGFGYTPNWFNCHFSGNFDYTLFHGGTPLYTFPDKEAEYDERKHFDEVTAWPDYDWDEWRQTCPPEAVTEVVREKDPDKGFVRYLQPHAPYRLYPHIHSIEDAQQHSDSELMKAHYNNFRWVLEEIKNNLLPYIEGGILITSDHGDCLGDCGQYFHSSEHTKHGHLVNVPALMI